MYTHVCCTCTESHSFDVVLYAISTCVHVLTYHVHVVSFSTVVWHSVHLLLAQCVMVYMIQSHDCHMIVVWWLQWKKTEPGPFAHSWPLLPAVGCKRLEQYMYTGACTCTLYMYIPPDLGNGQQLWLNCITGACAFECTCTCSCVHVCVGCPRAKFVSFHHWILATLWGRLACRICAS